MRPGVGTEVHLGRGIILDSPYSRVIIVNYDLMCVSKFPEEAISQEVCLR